MATSVYTTEDITLQDGTDVTLKPMPIARLRRFMQAWEGIDKIENDIQGYPVLINCAGIALEDNFTDKFENLKSSAADQKKGVFLSKEYLEYLENTLDLPTIYKVMDVCGGIKLNDPKVMEEALKAMQAQE